MNWKYIVKPNSNLMVWYKDKVKKGLNGFIDFDNFKIWYDENIRDNNCFYCGLTERESQEIVHSGFLQSNRFPFEGKFSKGVNRGYWLEIDRKKPKEIYSRENCVPSCYFCNNDKSDVFNDIQYLEFIKDRPKFIKSFLSKNEK